MFSKVATKIFGSRNQRLLRKMITLADKINAVESSLEALPDELLHEVDAILRATSTQGALRMRQTSKALNDRLKPLAGVLVERAWIRKVRAQQAERRTPDLVSEREREAALVEAEASLDSQVYQQEVAAAQMMERRGTCQIPDHAHASGDKQSDGPLQQVA